jgi:hypothetical protein
MVTENKYDNLVEIAKNLVAMSVLNNGKNAAYSFSVDGRIIEALAEELRKLES